MNLVLDPSVVIKWYVSEPLAREAVSLKEWIHRESHWVAVPELFLIEAANVLWKKCHLRKELSKKNTKEVLRALRNLPFRQLSSIPFLNEAMALSFDHSVTIYDALYLTTALHVRGPLITADEAFARRFERTALSGSVIPLSQLQRLKGPPD